MLSPDTMSQGNQSDAPMLRLDGFEGPLDLLLELARTQKVDLHRISILQLVEQYVAVVEIARVRVELAADWLVMAAWLTWLKSRLLLPADDVSDRPADGERAAALLAAGLLAERLAELAHVGRAVAWLGTRDRLGHEVFARGAAEDLTEIDRSGLLLGLPQLLGGYMTAMRRTVRRRPYRPKPLALWSVQDALLRLRRLLGDDAADWRAIEQFLPEWAGGGGSATTPERRAAVAGTLLAGLELARSGMVELRQQDPFGAILLRRTAVAQLAQAAE